MRTNAHIWFGCGGKGGREGGEGGEGGRRGKEEKYGKASVAKGRELGKQVDMLKIT